MNTRKAQEVLDTLVQRFEAGDIPEALARTTFPFIDVPSNKWSRMNRIMQMFAGTDDGRGKGQWNSVGRSIKAGSKAFYILVPKKLKKKAKNEEEDDIIIVTGFFAVPVYRYEDTVGEPVEYEKLELPDFPLMEKAEEWGVTVRTMGFAGDAYGYYNSGRKVIALATPEEKTFFHEMSHAAHDRIEHLKGGQDPFQEIVAELCAAALCIMVGKSHDDYFENSARYISAYAGEINMKPETACRRVITTCGKVLDEILAPVDMAVAA